MAEADRVIAVLRALTDHYIERPVDSSDAAPGTEAAVRDAVRYVSGMTDRFALRLAVERLGWKPDALPRVI